MIRPLVLREFFLPSRLSPFRPLAPSAPEAADPEPLIYYLRFPPIRQLPPRLPFNSLHPGRAMIK